MNNDNNTSTIGRTIRGNAFILLATIFFGVNVPVVKFLIPEWMTAMDVTVFRLVGGCILFWIASLFVRPDRIDKSDFPRILIGGGLGLFAFIFLFNLSLRYANPIDVSIIMTLPPVFVILINAVFHSSRPGKLEIAGVVLAFAGAAAVILGKHPEGHASDATLGNILALISGLCYAVYLVVLEKPTHKYRPVSMLRWVFLAAAVPALVLVPHLPEAAIFHSADTMEPWLMTIFVVTCPTFLAYLLINPAIKLIGSELVSIYQYLLPVVATIAAVMMHLAVLHAIQIVAMGVIIAAMVLINLSKRQKLQN